MRFWSYLVLTVFFAASSLAADLASPSFRTNAVAEEAGRWIDLMPAADLANWTRIAIPPTNTLGRAQWHLDAARQVLVCDGDGGHEMLRFDRELTNSTFHVEFRFVPVTGPKAKYNSGVFIRNSADGSFWHQCQLTMDGGYLFGVTPDGDQRKRFKAPASEKRMKAPGEWNSVEVTAVGSTITVELNGVEVSKFTECGNPSGYIALESEGYAIEFRNLKLKELASEFPAGAEKMSADEAVEKTPSGKSYTYKESGSKPRVMEIYFPPNHNPAKSKVPGLILFHGGGWTGGKLDQFRPACAYFASRGLVCATVEYRMLDKGEADKLPKGESRKRVCVTDAKSAIRWFKQHANELGVDPNRIIAGGGSAGGHISVIATMNPGLNDPADPKDTDTSVVAYLWFNPAFSEAGDNGDENDPEIDVLHQLKADLPPAIVFFGDQDHWKEGWDTAQAKWESLGAKTIDLQIAPGQTHGFFNQESWRTVTLIAADRFLVKQGLLTGEPTLRTPSKGQKLISAHQNK